MIGASKENSMKKPLRAVAAAICRRGSDGTENISFCRKRRSGKSVWVEFEGVYQNSDVWVNDHHLGHYPNGYMSFYYDLSPFIHAGENILSVRVDNSMQPNSRWYSGSGIYRNVWLHIAGQLHVAQWGNYITTPRADSGSAEVVIRTTIDNRGSAERRAILRLAVTDSAGHLFPSRRPRPVSRWPEAPNR